MNIYKSESVEPSETKPPISEEWNTEQEVIPGLAKSEEEFVNLKANGESDVDLQEKQSTEEKLLLPEKEEEEEHFVTLKGVQALSTKIIDAFALKIALGDKEDPEILDLLEDVIKGDDQEDSEEDQFFFTE